MWILEALHDVLYTPPLPHSPGYFCFASVELPFRFRYASVMQAEKNTLRGVSPQIMEASVVLPLSFRYASVMQVK